MSPLDPRALKAALYRAAHEPAFERELKLASAAWFQGVDPDDPQAGPSCPEAWLEFLDFFALEWVDAGGYTLLERTWRGPLPHLLLRWLLDVRSGVFVVDEWSDGFADARDAMTEEALVIRVGEPLPPRSVITGRLLPDGQGGWVPSGSPDVYDPMRVIQRMDLARGWQEHPRWALVSRLRSLRRAFVVQREQQAAFARWFGADEVLFDGPRAMREGLNAFFHHLLYEDRPPSLGGQSRAERFGAGGEAPFALQVELGPSLDDGGRPGIIFDAAEGVHMLPSLGEFYAHLRGEAAHPEVVRLYLEEPGISALPFRRAGATAALAALLGRPDGPLEALLAPHKPLDARAAPSLLAELEG